MRTNLRIITMTAIVSLLSVPMWGADGAALYKTKCAGCHGADAKGKPAMKTRDWSSEDIQKMSDDELGAIITNGKSPMPAYKTMTADQVKDMVAYVRTFKK